MTWPLRRDTKLMVVAILDSLWARRKIQDEIKQMDETFEEQLVQKISLAKAVTNTDMDRFENLEHDRLKSIESKARTNLMSITIATTIAAIFLGAQFTAAECGGEPHYPVSAIVGYTSVGLGWLCLVVSGLCALPVLNVWQSYTVTPSNHLDAKEVELRARRLFNLEQNQRLMLLKVNALSVSFHATRNGIILFFVGMVVIAMARFGSVG